MKLCRAFFLFIGIACCFHPLRATYTVKGGKIIDVHTAATLTVQEHHSLAVVAYEDKNWKELVQQATIVTTNFPGSPFARDAYFFLGVGYFHLEEYGLANKNLTSHLKKQGSSRHFEEAMSIKLQIAERFHHGAKEHVLGWKMMPKWIPAKEEALAIYDEVINALPHHDLAARALYGRASLRFYLEEFRPAIDDYQLLIRRFPHHYLAPESYYEMSRVYWSMCRVESPDPDFLDLAEVSLRKFRQDFPGAPRVSEAEGLFQQMREYYASTLYEMGQFYERTKKPHAALIYYNKILLKYGDTEIAKRATQRTSVLGPPHEK